jgi:hypothetical protein
MRISSGIAEVNLGAHYSNRITSEKAYIWPVYDAGKVNHVQGVTRRTESNVVYAKPLPEEHIRLLTEFDAPPSAEYDSRGKVGSHRSLACRPGTFFEALA